MDIIYSTINWNVDILIEVIKSNQYSWLGKIFHIIKNKFALVLLKNKFCLACHSIKSTWTKINHNLCEMGWSKGKINKSCIAASKKLQFDFTFHKLVWHNSWLCFEQEAGLETSCGPFLLAYPMMLWSSQQRGSLLYQYFLRWRSTPPLSSSEPA